jgi:hypothetical protein
LKKQNILILLILLTWQLALPQSIRVNGFIRATGSDEPLPYATCYNAQTGIGVAANEWGYFSISVPSGTVELEASYAGFLKQRVTHVVTCDTLIVIHLAPFALAEVEVRAKQTPFHTQSMAGKITLPLATLEAVPTFLGQADVIKAITYLPGVSTGKDGSTTLLIRGGNRDQNLVLIDGCPVFNVSHLAGFFSLFNTNAIQHVDLYKNSYPARFGGKASSVLDIRMREGNREKLTGEASVGIISSGFLLEGPIKNDRTSFLLSGRISNLYLIQHQARQDYKKNDRGEYTDYHFWDVNAKVNHRINSTDRVFLNLFTGGDLMKFHQKSAIKEQTSMADYDYRSYSIRNLASTLGYQKVIGNNVFLSLSAYTSMYDYTDQSESNQTYNGISNIFRTGLSTSIREFGLQANASYQHGYNHTLRMGLKHSVTPLLGGQFNNTSYTPRTGESLDSTFGTHGMVYPVMHAIYLEDEWSITPAITLHSGLRYSAWLFNNHTHHMVDPRIAIRIKQTDNLSYSLGYSLSHQPLHGVVSMSYPMDREIWIPATDKLLPQKVQQVSAGVYGLIDRLGLECSVDVFYKLMYNLLEFRERPNEWNLTPTLEDLITGNGMGEVYGTELLLEKRHPKFIASAAYTLSWNNRQFKEINLGRTYPSDYDRRHDLNLLLNITPSSNLSYGVLFALQTGTPVTLPSGYYGGQPLIPNFWVHDRINDHRLPLYHRLDVTMKRSWDNKRNRKKHLALNIFNVYARKNAAVIHMSDNGSVIQESYMSIIPSLTFTYEF